MKLVTNRICCIFSQTCFTSSELQKFTQTTQYSFGP